LISICISTRNRAPLLAQTLESIEAKHYGDTEVVVLDDSSTDGTTELLSRKPWVRAARIERDGGYRNDPASVFNQLMAMATGEILIQQSAEVVHLTPVARQLAEASEPGVVVFPTVLNGRADQLHRVAAAVAQGWMAVPDEWSGNGVGWIDPEQVRPDGGAGVASPPVAAIVGGERIEIYTGAARAVPFFFAGAIQRDDWLRTGGYPENVEHGASDLHLAFRMVALGLRFRFLGGAIAYHVSHDKR
jgi:hypothetical protein